MNFYNDISVYSDRIAVISETGEKYSYKKLTEDADRLSLNIPERSLIFLICENCYESIMAYIAFLRKKIVPILISPKNDSNMIEQLMYGYKPQYIFSPTDRTENFGTEAAVFGCYHLVKTKYSETPEMNPELAVLITTSGSTGSPKFVMQSYKNIESNTEAIAQYLDISPDDRAITTMPMSYTFGLSIIQSHLFRGAAVIATEKTLMDKGFWSLLREQQATTFGGVPYIYQMLKMLRFGRMELPSLKYITQAGGRLPKELGLEFSEICRDKGIKFIIMYGQTEATARMSYLPWEYAFTKAGTIGIPIPGGEMLLIDGDGREITEPDTVGELVYKGDNVTLGYARCADDLKNPDIRNGVLFTGDMAMRDSDGFYTIVGRKKRFLKIFGNRVNLDEVEAMLNRNGFECVCSGRDDLMKIYIVSENDDDLKNAVDFISTKTGLNRSAFKAVSVPSIPRNDSGKILYSELEKLYGEL